jgi:hypothetical protein
MMPTPDSLTQEKETTPMPALVHTNIQYVPKSKCKQRTHILNYYAVFPPNI